MSQCRVHKKNKNLDLRMNTCYEQLLGKIRPKSVAILRTRAYYDVPELLNQYKTHIWGLVEIYSCAYFHAASTLLQKITQVQQSFLHKLELSEDDACLKYNFAPTDLRRNIAALGIFFCLSNAILLHRGSRPNLYIK